jgi:hypothetical protein
MQVDALSHRIPNFVAKAARAGCRKVFIGLESINPESLKGTSKGQNHISEYRKMLQTWRGSRSDWTEHRPCRIDDLHP